MTIDRLVGGFGVLALTAAGLAGCGPDHPQHIPRASAAPCPALIGETADKQPPFDVPRPADGKAAYADLLQGKTKYFYFALPGGPGTLSAYRDDYDSRLKSAGYAIEATDQQSGSDAESQFHGKTHDGSTRWRSLCRDHVQLRLELND